jgi:uncharacterized protein with PIN domain
VFYRQNNLSTLVITALRQERIILTRNSGISRFPGPRIVVIKSDFVDQQIKQLLQQLRLKPKAKDMFTRCLICNLQLAAIAKTKVKSRVPEYVYKTQKDFVGCPKCKKVYWQGTHWGNAKKFLSKLVSP